MSQASTISKEIAYFMRRLYKRGLTTTSGGNISVRSGGLVFITPSQTDKGRMRASDILAISIEDLSAKGAGKPSMETGMHLAVYAVRPDVSAIVHAHPVVATGFAAAHKPVDCSLVGEARALLQQPVLAPYQLMGTEDLAQTVAEACRNAHAVLMANHGVLTTGKNLLEAFDRLEVLESCARINLIATMLGGGKRLDPEQLRAIDKLMNP